MTHPFSHRPRFLGAWVVALSLLMPVASAQQAVLVPTENVRVEYGQVLRAEPIYEIRRETWLERQCPDGRNRLLSRIAGAVKDALKPGKAEEEEGACRDVPVEREFRRLAAYEVDYMYKGSKYRSRMPYDPGNRIKLRVSVTPYAVYPGR
ncbi:MAG TPA: hypothetical protein VHF86_08130 [Xanthomonadaceae bacterium]|nr:hypothetical protein [Xanthomonadaceae bacterium]